MRRHVSSGVGCVSYIVFLLFFVFPLFASAVTYEFQVVQCPGTSGRCSCAQNVELPGHSKCPAGSFCQTTNASVTCSPGLYCPEGSNQPVLCCEGYYCPTPKEIKVCPAGSYCRTGQIEPFRCAWMESCAEGSVDGEHVGVYAFFALALICIFLAFQFKSYMDRRRSRRRAFFIEHYEDMKISEVSPVTTTEFDRRPVSESSSTGSVAATYDIRFEDLGLTLPSGKTVLHGVSGTIIAGRCCAVMGPSGCGKTTFLSVLSGKVRKSRGRLLVNDKEEAEGLGNYRSTVGFVPQEDVMIRTDTVQNILSFAAEFRCDRSLSHTDRKIRVANAIKLLGLSGIRESIIGDERKRGISGGQRKRVNIGIEIVSDPKILFLDEPTSGLDSTASLDVCKVLKNLARKQGVAVAAVIHQPRYEIFAAFDDLLLLGRGGRTAYMGPTEDVLAYFEGLGFVCPPKVNAADFVMDIVAGQVQWDSTFPFDPVVLPSIWLEYVKRASEPGNEPLNRRASDFALHAKEAILASSGSASSSPVIVDVPELNIFPEGDTSTSPPSPAPESSKGMTEQKNEREHEKYKKPKNASYRVKALASDFLIDGWLALQDVGRFVKESLAWKNVSLVIHSFPMMFYLCFRRSLRSRFSSAGAFLRENVLHLLCGLFLGIAAKQLQFVGPLPSNVRSALCPVMLMGFCTYPLQDEYQVIAVFICWGLTFAGIASGVSTFGPEEVNYWREVASGLPSLPYFLSKFCTDIFRMLIAAGLFEFAYLCIYETSMNAGLLFAIALMFYFNGFVLGYIITILYGITMAPLVGIVLALLYSIVLSGFQPSLGSIQPGLMWIYDTSYARWGVEAYYDAEVSRFDYYADMAVAYQEYGYMQNQAPTCILNMLYIGIGWTIVAYLVMVFCNLGKKR
eukprot:ANDGO_02105.mRNA.1 ABC transporter G family member 28